MSEFEEGRVYMGRVDGGEEQVLLRVHDAGRAMWRGALGLWTETRVTDVRPLVTLDIAKAPGRMEGGQYWDWVRLVANTDRVKSGESHRVRFARWIADEIERQIRPRMPEPESIGSRVISSQVGEADGSDRQWVKFRKDGWIDQLDHIRSWNDLANPRRFPER